MRQSTVAMATVVLDLQLVTIYAGHDARMRPLAGRAAHRAELYRGSPGAPASARE